MKTFIRAGTVALVILWTACLLGGQELTADVSANDTASSDKTSNGNDFLDMDIEQLRQTKVTAPSFDVEVTSVTKSKSTVGRSPAAIFVITQEMIHDSGYTTIPDLLRMVPGMDVAQMNSHMWAVSCRGFNGQFANKLLVLIDGRSVYNQLYGGVYWDTQDVVFDDIERIEVIRGPGGTLWGDNAVNGVVNIITKSAKDTQGTLVSVGGGNWNNLLDNVRVGGNNGNGFHWRIFGKHFERGNEWSADGAQDNWRIGRGGFRIDWDLDKYNTDKLTVLGDYYGGEEAQEFFLPLPVSPYSETLQSGIDVSGANILTRWQHRISKDSDWKLQLYFDRTFREEVQITKQQTNTLDVEFQHRFPLSQRQSLTWGMDYRQVHDYLPTESFSISYVPEQRTTNLLSGFLQDEITLIEDRLFFTIGTKIEHNSYSGFECQPSARVLCSPDERHAAWVAVSRAVRTPTRLDENAIINTSPIFISGVPWFIRINGNPDINAEALMSYEFGYRAQTTENFSWDITGFYNVYDNLMGLVYGIPYSEGSYIVWPTQYANTAWAHVYGFELTAQWKLSERLRLSAWYGSLYSYVQRYNDYDEGPPIPNLVGGTSPRNQTQLHCGWKFAEDWDLDMRIRYVDRLPELSVPAYLTMDIRLGWQPRKNVEVSLVGQNLLQNHHLEFTDAGSAFSTDQVRRTVYAQLTWRR